MELYDQLVEEGIPLDNHESDLYCKASDKSLALVKLSGHSYSMFTNNIDGELWIDVPFAWAPFWRTRQARPVIGQEEMDRITESATLDSLDDPHK